MIKKIFLVVAALLALFLLVGLALPREYDLERSITISAPAEVVFEQVNDLQKNRAWSPWEEDDPSAEFQYGPTISGIGAFYDWQGDKVGAGRLTITGVDPNRRIETELAFGDATTAVAVWTFDETDAGLRVTWGVDGDYGNSLFARYFGLFIRGVLEENFERGLANLKRVTEAMPLGLRLSWLRPGS